MPDIVKKAYYLLAAMFIGLYVLAVGAMIRVPPFDKIDSTHTNVLFSALLVETAIIALALLRGLPSLKSALVQKYSVRVNYDDYWSIVYKSLSSDDKLVVQSFDPHKLAEGMTRQQLGLIAEMVAAQRQASQVATGDAYLTIDSERQLINGTLLYQFPGNATPTSSPVAGNFMSDGGFDLFVTQPERIIDVGPNRLVVPEAPLHVKLHPTTNGALVGKVFHPRRKDDEGNPIQICTATISP